MGSDMVVALGRATLDGHTLFGHNCTRPVHEPHALRRQPGRAAAVGEKVQAQYLSLPQVRQTATVLAVQAAGRWGYEAGVNEHGVALGLTPIRARLRAEQPGLAGTDLVRLCLERAGSTRQAVDLLTDLISRHGQGGGDPGESDHAFLVADGVEAFAVEATGTHWAIQEVREVRAVASRSQIRQDWNRISRGLSDLAIARGWWPEDGSKLDFAAVVGQADGDDPATLRRWGRATVLLEQENGRLTPAYLRSVLSDCPEAPEANPFAPTHGLPAESFALCQVPSAQSERATAASFLCALPRDRSQPPVVWVAFGPPVWSVYFPLFLEADLPLGLQAGAAGGCTVWQALAHVGRLCRDDREHAAFVRSQLAGLQTMFDQMAQETAQDMATLRHRGEHDHAARLAEALMQHNLERFEELHPALAEPARRPHGAPRAARELAGTF